jgi:hypothetical protein
MPAAGKLLLVEGVLPTRMQRSPWHQIIAGSDVNMMVNIGGRERTEAEFRTLFETAGFHLTRIVPTSTTTTMSILEGARK